MEFFCSLVSVLLVYAVSCKGMYAQTEMVVNTLRNPNAYIHLPKRIFLVSVLLSFM